jgi:DNA-binding MarR family transcriptional regulator
MNIESKELKYSISCILNQSGRLLSNKLNKTFSDNGHKITREQWITLSILKTEKGITQQNLADRGFKNKASITSLIDHMEANNLVIRSSDKSDRRIKRIYLTKDGEELYDKLTQSAFTVIDDAVKDIKEEDLVKSMGILSQIINNLTTV